MVVPISDFDLGDVLRDLFVGQAALQRFLQLLHLVGSYFGRRYADIGHAEYDPFAATGAGGLPDAILGGAERRGDQACGHAGR